jgi:hypothetical protein
MELIERHCNGCDTTKSIEEFAKDRNDKSGYTYRCKVCRNKKQKEWVTRNPEKVKELNLKHRETRKEYYSTPERKFKYRKKYIEKTFGIPYEEYERLFDLQSGVCAICSQPERSSKNSYLSVDHCHTTGVIRGLLCNSCNRALGYFYDSTSNLINAVNYLNKQ